MSASDILQERLHSQERERRMIDNRHIDMIQRYETTQRVNDQLAEIARLAEEASEEAADDAEEAELALLKVLKSLGSIVFAGHRYERDLGFSGPKSIKITPLDAPEAAS